MLVAPHVRPEMFSLEDRAWAAGFIDGEGTIGVYKGKRGKRNGRSDHYEYFLKVSAVNTNMDPLDKLKLMFGGSIQQMGKGTDKWKPSWFWVVSHRAAERALRALRGLLMVKHEQAVLGLEARGLIGNGMQRNPETIRRLEEIEQMSRRLNRKGPSI